MTDAYIHMGFPHSSVGKESACNAGDLGSIPGLGRSPGEEKGYPLNIQSLLLQYKLHETRGQVLFWGDLSKEYQKDIDTI